MLSFCLIEQLKKFGVDMYKNIDKSIVEKKEVRQAIGDLRRFFIGRSDSEIVVICKRVADAYDKLASKPAEPVKPAEPAKKPIEPVKPPEPTKPSKPRNKNK